MWLGAAALEIAHVNTGSVLIDEFASRFVYFYTGYVFARQVFALAEEASSDHALALTGLALWAIVEWSLVFHGYGDLPFVSLGLGLIGALAVVTLATQLAQTRLAPAFRWLGEHSIVIYLSFFLPMATSRALLLKSGVVSDVGSIALLVTLCGIVFPILFYVAIQRTGFGKFLFERPQWARIDRPYRRPREEREVMVPAE